MELSKFKKLALVAVAAGLTAQPVVATEGNIAEEAYYAASCGGAGKSCGGGGYAKPYTQSNPAPIAEETAPSKNMNGTQPSNSQGTKSNGSTQANRFYQKRDSNVADASLPSNGQLPSQSQQKPASTTKVKAPGTGTTTPNPSSSKY